MAKMILTTHTPKNCTQQKTMKMMAQAKPTVKVLQKEYLFLLVRPKRAVEHATDSSEATQKPIASKINHVEAKIVIKRMWVIFGKGVLLLVNSTADLVKLETEIKTELVNDFLISKPRRRQRTSIQICPMIR